MSKRSGDDFLGMLFGLAIVMFLIGPIAATGAATGSSGCGLVTLRIIVALILAGLIAASLILGWALWTTLVPAFILTLLVGAWIGRTIGGWKAD